MRRLLGRIYDSLPFKQPILSLLRPLGLPQSIYKHLHFLGEFEVQTPGQPFRRVHYGYEIENDLFWERLPGRRERVSMQLWMELARHSSVVVDVGANTGIYSLVAKAVNPNAKVHGFEPVSRVFQKYVQNCRLNGFDIVAEELALSNQDGTATLYDFNSEHVLAATLDREIYAELPGEQREVSVPVTKLSTYIAARGLERVDLMKIDVESHEPEVLEGLGAYLQSFKPTLLIEVLTDAVGRSLERIVGGLGYLYFDIDEVNPPRRVEQIRKSGHWNYLLCQPAVADRLGLR